MQRAAMMVVIIISHCRNHFPMVQGPMHIAIPCVLKLYFDLLYRRPKKIERKACRVSQIFAHPTQESPGENFPQLAAKFRIKFIRGDAYSHMQSLP